MKAYLEKCLDGHDLTSDEASRVLEMIMTGQATESQIGAILTALRAKGESEDEIVGFARTMRNHAVKITADDPDAIDMCGTGGDGLGTFNISTVASLVAAGAGVTVAKHGNRSVSSRSGSADVFRALGVNVEISATRVESCLNTVGIGFLFAPLFHPAMKSVAKCRQELGVRTIFNMLGPITNPADVRRQIVGTYHHKVAHKLAGALQKLDTNRACVLYGAEGMDEVSLSGETHVREVSGGRPPRAYAITHDDFGLNHGSSDAARGGDPAHNAAITREILGGEKVPGRDVVIANAALGIYVAGKAENLLSATMQARESIDSGRARDILSRLVEHTNRP